LDLPSEKWLEMQDGLTGLFISNMGRYYSKYMNKLFGVNQNNSMVLKYKNKKHQIARLVLIMFMSDPPSDKHIAYHIDNNSTNNCINNLYWELKNKNVDHNHEKRTKTMLKKIVQYKNNIEIKKFDSIKIASAELNMSGTNILCCVNDMIKSTDGYELKYENDFDLIDEIWAEHPITKIQVSTKGRFKTKYKKTFGSLNKKSNYYQFNNKQAHRLIAETFIENPENKKTVDHINGDTTNNCVDNLRWATMKEQNLNKHHLQIL
jgi:hypothetical protein